MPPDLMHKLGLTPRQFTITHGEEFAFKFGFQDNHPCIGVYRMNGEFLLTLIFNDEEMERATTWLDNYWVPPT